MHHIYHTEAIILGSRNYGESGKVFYLLTRDFGLIFASARGIRKVESRLRYVLNDFAYVKVDLVRGKDFWRITSPSKTNELDTLQSNHSAVEVVARTSNLLRRLLRGEEGNTELFSDFLAGLKALEKIKTKEEAHAVEIIMVLRILNNLGYIGDTKELENFTRSPLEDVLVFSESNRRAVIREINRALRETQL